MLDLSELYQFITYAECGTLSAAAEILHISQPTLTRTMHHVEEAFGAPLFHRGKNRIELTDTGKVAVEQASSLLAEAEKAIQAVQAFERNQHMITIHSCAPVPLWSLLPELSRRFPENIISSKLTTNMDEIIQNVISGNADIGILPQSCPHKDPRCIPYLQEQLYVCIPEEHTLAEQSHLSLSQINGFNCLLRDEIGFWTDLVKKKCPHPFFWYKQTNLSLRNLYEPPTLLCFSSNRAADPNQTLKGRKLIPLTDPEVNITYHLISPVSSSTTVLSSQEK